jgi:hypothetical protein
MEWWEDVCSGDVTYKSTKGAKKEFTVTAALVAKVLGSGEGDEVSEVQPVMCSLLATYFAAAWADTPWLHFLPSDARAMRPRRRSRLPAKARYYDAAAVASSTNIPTIDHVARASAVLSFEFKPRPARQRPPVRVLNEARPVAARRRCRAQGRDAGRHYAVPVCVCRHSGRL